jgi:hypothetical protein
MYVGMYVGMYASMYVGMYADMYSYIHGGREILGCVYIYMYMYTYIEKDMPSVHRRRMAFLEANIVGRYVIC